MAHVPLVPIGKPRSEVLDDRSYDEHVRALSAREETLSARRREVHAGWGPKYVERVHKKGKLTARERVERLIDAGSRTFEVGTFVNQGETFGTGDEKLTSPGAGVVTCFARVANRWCVIIANDNTVASGSWWPRTPEKIQRAQEMARKLRLPTIYLVDCSGLFLPEQSKSFPGARGAGHIFKMNSLLSAEGVPQIAGVFGDCIAGGGYQPIISDRVYMTEQAYMVIAGAALIKGAKSQKLTSRAAAPTCACPTTRPAWPRSAARSRSSRARPRTSIDTAWAASSRESRRASSRASCPSITARPTTRSKCSRASVIRASSGSACRRWARRSCVASAASAASTPAS
jgi:hypothetical protein